MTIFFAVSIPLFSKFMERAKMDTAARSVASALRTARSYAITRNADYYVVFDTSTTPDEYFVSADSTNPIDKKYKLPAGIWFCRPGAVADPIGEAIEFTGDIACFKPTGELNETAAETLVYLADGDDASAENTKTMTVERTTGRVKIN